MIVKRVIYQETQQTFFDDVLTNTFFQKMEDTAQKYNISTSKSEKISWQNNASKIQQLLMLSKVNDAYVTFEYMVPYNMKRIDCIIYGKDSSDQGNVVHIELKQWSNDSVKPSQSDGNFSVDDSSDSMKVNAFTGGAYRLVAHPSQQVRGYNDYLTGFIEVFSTNQLKLNGVAYCYNYKKNCNESVALYDPKYDSLQKDYRTYSGDEVKELAEKIHDALCQGDGFSIFNKMMTSPIRPSKKLLESAAELVDKGNVSEFSLIDDQIVAKNIILDKIRKLGRKKKSIILVKGGPGTGKTVIALHVLATLAKSDKPYNIRYATKSKPLLEGVKNRLPRGSAAKLLFSNVVQFIPANCEENSLDVLLIDEAHRITKTSNNRFTPISKQTNLSQIETIVQAAKIGVFFIDDKQAIRSQEIGSTDMIKECAERFGAEIEEVELTSQFRCNGSDNYLDWLEQVLYNEPLTASFDKNEFDFRIFDTPESFYKEIEDKNNVEGQTARLTAGFCWPWSKTLDENGDLVKDVKIGDFAMPWETHDDIKKIPEGYVKWYEWAYKPEGVKQVGCIYTAQGFEFDYIGVIVGKDLKYSKINDCLITDQSATEDKTLKRAGFDEYVRNIYRVLMSRGMKGCYVYFCDKEVENYFKRTLGK